MGFDSDADNLVPGDTNNTRDAFIHDRLTGRTARISIGPAGQQGDGPSSDVALSADGRIVAFHSAAENFSGPSNGVTDVFLRLLYLDEILIPFVQQLE